MQNPVRRTDGKYINLNLHRKGCSRQAPRCHRNEARGRRTSSANRVLVSRESSGGADPQRGGDGAARGTWARAGPEDESPPPAWTLASPPNTTATAATAATGAPDDATTGQSGGRGRSPARRGRSTSAHGWLSGGWDGAAWEDTGAWTRRPELAAGEAPTAHGGGTAPGDVSPALGDRPARGRPSELRAAERVGPPRAPDPAVEFAPLRTHPTRPRSTHWVSGQTRVLRHSERRCGVCDHEPPWFRSKPGAASPAEPPSSEGTARAPAPRRHPRGWHPGPCATVHAPD